MSKINDGGPAFPRASTLKPNGESWTDSQFGMTLRDWFAGQAMAEIYAARFDLNYTGGETIGQAVARNSYDLADAMLAAREAKQ